jgi:polysaccharide export outer membrane protein
VATPCYSQEVTSQPVSVTTPAATGSAEAAYILGAGDEIRITVFNEPDLAVQQKIGADGGITVPLIGGLNANGMSTEQLSQALAARFRDGYLRNPQVSVSVVTYRPFYVIGEVNNPGAFPYAANLTITSAIATAGGFNHRASKGEVFVRRQGEVQEHAYPITAAVSLAPGDTIRVGQSFLATLGDIPFGLVPR